MTHDLLKLAEECERRTWRTVFDSPLLADDFLCFKNSAAALRAAHEEREYFNSFRDELQTANTKLTLEKRELRALVKRHEAALEILKSPELIEVLADIEHRRWSSWMRHHLANDTEDNRARWSGLMNTPYAELLEHSKESDRREVRKTLSAIEAAMKEGK